MALTKAHNRMIEGAPVNVKDFGAVGDGTTDDTTALAAAFAQATNNSIWFEPNKTYKVTNAIVVGTNTTVELNGSTVQFVITGSTNCFDLRDGVIIRNGAVDLAGSGYTGHGGNGCPIIIGRYETGVGYENILIEDLDITSNKTDGNGIFITGDSHNIQIQSINFPSSSTLGRGIAVHWGFAGTPASGTTHPYNLLIQDIEINNQTYDSGDNGAVFLSSCYNTTVKRVRGGVCDEWGFIRLFCGDYGFDYAPTNVAANGMTGITIEDCSVEIAEHLFTVAMRDTLGTTTLWPSQITVRQLSGSGHNPTDSATRAFNVEEVTDLTIQDCTANNFYDGIICGKTVHRLLVKDCILKNNYRSGFWATSAGTPDFQNIKIQNCYFKDNNQGGSASVADLLLLDGDDITIDGCVFDSTDAIWNVRITNASTRAFVKNNLSRNVKSTDGPAFSFGSSSDYGIVSLFSNNVVVNVPTNGIVSGQLHKNFVVAAGGNAAQAQQRMATYSAAPTAGTWNVGDIVFNSAPSAGGTIGWVCTTAGTPGTWKTFGTIAS